MIKIYISLITIYILNIIDYFQTMYGIQLVGIGIEANPIGRFIIENNYGWVCKFIVIPMPLAIIGIIIRTERKLSLAVYLLLAWYLFVVANNFIVLARL